MEYFSINDRDFSRFVASMKVDMETLLSDNSGRNAAGDNVVDIVNHKDKIECSFIPMTASEMADFMTTIEDYVIDIGFLDPRTDSIKHIIAYHGTPTPEFYRIIDGKILYKAMNLNFIEM